MCTVRTNVNYTNRATKDERETDRRSASKAAQAQIRVIVVLACFDAPQKTKGKQTDGRFQKRRTRIV